MTGTDPESLHQPVTVLKGVGPRVAERLTSLGVSTIQDLLFHLPLRYEDRTRIVPMGSLRAGERVVVEGEVELTEVVYRRRRMMLSRIADGTGSITLRFFHFSNYQKEGLKRGTRLRCYGEVRKNAGGLEMAHPEYRRISPDENINVEESLTAVYPVTEGLRQAGIRQIINQALEYLEKTSGPQDLLDSSIFDHKSFLHLDYSISQALHYVHKPPPDASLELLQLGKHPSQQRLVIEELLAHFVSLQHLRQRARQFLALPLQADETLIGQFITQLGFELTSAQHRVVDEILQDLQQTHPMMRLVQGDVGSGKTVVAAIAALNVINNNCQVALMAPTEILAEQHYRTLEQWLHEMGIQIAWLSGKQKGKARQQAMSCVADGSAQMVIGTHALFQEEVQFKHLALVVVDEQHRFGVHQRLRLMEKGSSGRHRPHQLIMTATPIPRTLTMTAYADLDVSVIDELPPGRKPVTTVVMPEERRDEIITRVEQVCQEGKQVYWVCPLIEESEQLAAQAATLTHESLSSLLPELHIGLVHGRMKPAEKDEVMQAFKSSAIDLLVATTVIEVGVDVPNASLMIIENAERLGLSQLHQLRGRVGRGNTQSHCVLMYRPPLGDTAHERLAIMRDTNDGFEIARRDMEIRGPGEVLGTRQTGMMNMYIADLIRDQPLMPEIKQAAIKLTGKSPEKIEPLVRRWLKQNLQFADV
jgi:ATP-dependent DNA helicase RecG